MLTKLHAVVDYCDVGTVYDPPATTTPVVPTLEDAVLDIDVVASGPTSLTSLESSVDPLDDYTVDGSLAARSELVDAVRASQSGPEETSPIGASLIDSDDEPIASRLPGYLNSFKTCEVSALRFSFIHPSLSHFFFSLSLAVQFSSVGFCTFFPLFILFSSFRVFLKTGFFSFQFSVIFAFSSLLHLVNFSFLLNFSFPLIISFRFTSHFHLSSFLSLKISIFVLVVRRYISFSSFRFFCFSLIFPDENIILHHFFITPSVLFEIFDRISIFRFYRMCKRWFCVIIFDCLCWGVKY